MADNRLPREHSDPKHSEFTVVKAEAYLGINEYLSTLSNTGVRTLEDVIIYNRSNKGTEGAEPGDVAAFPTGQDNLLELAAHAGRKNETYYQALEHTRKQSRENGFDAALKRVDENGETTTFDAMLICDDKGAGQQLAAQAGYPIITIPVGLDNKGMPVGLSIHHTAWQEGVLIKWASAIEDLLHESNGRRATPTFRNYTSKNIPID